MVYSELEQLSTPFNTVSVWVQVPKVHCTCIPKESQDVSWQHISNLSVTACVQYSSTTENLNGSIPTTVALHLTTGQSIHVRSNHGLIDTVCISLLHWKPTCIHVHMNYLVLNLEGNIWRKLFSVHFLPVSKSVPALYSVWPKDRNGSLAEKRLQPPAIEKATSSKGNILLTKHTEESCPTTARLNETNFSQSCFNLPDQTLRFSCGYRLQNKELEKSLNSLQNLAFVNIFSVLTNIYWQLSVTIVNLFLDGILVTQCFPTASIESVKIIERHEVRKSEHWRMHH